jgi:mRNA interferase MazF
MVSAPRRGHIYQVNFNPSRGSEQAGIRPALIVSNDVGNQHSSTVIVAAITSQIKRDAPYPFQVHLPDGTLPKPSLVLCDQLFTCAKERLGQLMGVVSDEETLDNIDQALRYSLELG